MEYIRLHSNYGWDFSQVNLRTMSPDGIFTAQYKKDAVAFAKSRGWRVGDVSRGYNAWMAFYFVGHMISPKEWQILRKDGTASFIPYNAEAAAYSR